VLALLGPGAGAAFELRLWPLVDIERSPEERRFRLLGPILEWRQNRERQEWFLRPFLRVSQHADGSQSGSLLYPLVRWQSSAEASEVHAAGIASFDTRARAEPDRPWTRRFTLFPLVFYRFEPEAGHSLSVVPFYADLPGFFGIPRVRMVLFPLFLRLSDPLYERTWLPFPFVSWASGALGRGIRLWPLYGRTLVGERSETLYFAWPFYLRRIERTDREDRIETRILWPLASRLEGSTVESRSYGFLLFLPLWTRTVDRASDTETLGFPWPAWVLQRSLATGERLSLRLAPFYQDRRDPTLRSVFYLWPLYRRREGLGEDSGERRRDVLFVVFREESSRAARRRVRVVLPFWVSRWEGERGRGQSPALLDGVLPWNEEIVESWSPLWRVFEVRRDGPDERVEPFWGMWERRRGRWRPPLSLRLR
jgi:hypothetical protein